MCSSDLFYRELVRTINQKRKQMKLTIKDRIIVGWNSDEVMIKKVFDRFSEELKKNVLANEIKEEDGVLEKVKLNNIELSLKIKKR